MVPIVHRQAYITVPIPLHHMDDTNCTYYPILSYLLCADHNSTAVFELQWLLDSLLSPVKATNWLISIWGHEKPGSHCCWEWEGKVVSLAKNELWLVNSSDTLQKIETILFSATVACLRHHHGSQDSITSLPWIQIISFFLKRLFSHVWELAALQRDRVAMWYVISLDTRRQNTSDYTRHDKMKPGVRRP